MTVGKMSEIKNFAITKTNIIFDLWSFLETNDMIRTLVSSITDLDELYLEDFIDLHLVSMSELGAHKDLRFAIADRSAKKK